MKHSIEPTVGNWTPEEGFFNREHERADLAERIRAGANVSLVAPRRVGKTSLLRAVARDLDADFACLFIDLEAASSAEEAVREIAEAAGRHQGLATYMKGWLSMFKPSASVSTPVGEFSVDLREALQVDWQRRGHQLIEALVRDNHKVVLFIDELPILVRTLLRQQGELQQRSPADVFMSWLRKLTQEHRGKLRVVMTGSIGLGPMLARAKLTATTNNFEHLTLRPWDPAVTVAALHALARHTGTPLTESAARRMAELLGIGVPYHVQLFFKHVRDHARQQQLASIEADHVEAVWNDRLLVDHTDLPHWEQRLQAAVDDGHGALAERLLTAAALHEPLTAAAASALHPNEGDLKAILEVLEHDGYLARRDDGWYFPNRLLRAWWARKHGQWVTR
jgi:hypothetical protein